MQLVQSELHRVAVKLVKGKQFDEKSEDALRREFRSVFGDAVAIEIQYVPLLDQTGAGKYRFSICNV